MFNKQTSIFGSLLAPYRNKKVPKEERIFKWGKKNEETSNYEIVSNTSGTSIKKSKEDNSDEADDVILMKTKEVSKIDIIYQLT